MTRTILVPIAGDLPIEPLLDAALATAQRIDGHIRALFIRPDTATALSYVPDMMLAAGITEESIERETAGKAAVAKDRFEAWRRDNGIPVFDRKHQATISASWSDRIGSLEPMVTRFGRISNMIVTSRPAQNSLDTQHCFDAAVFGTGRPTLVIGGSLPAGFAEHILIAWNGSLEASRAVAGAMPLLERAKRLSILTAREYDDEAVDLTDLAEAIADRGIHTPEIVFPAGGRSPGAELVAAVNSQKATLIVMGAYTHSRLRERFLGGVTRHLLAHSPVPLLMCH